MPKGPRGEKRPADAIGAAVKTMKILTGEIDEEADGKDPAARSLGQRGGKARAQALSKKRRKEIARAAARKRWGRSE